MKSLLILALLLLLSASPSPAKVIHMHGMIFEDTITSTLDAKSTREAVLLTDQDQPTQLSEQQAQVPDTETIAIPSTPASVLSPFFFAILNGNYIANGVGLRDSCCGAIEIAGLPECATIRAAFLFWMVLSFSCPPLHPVYMNGWPVGEWQLAGQVSASPCWPPSDSYTFAADVTDIVSRVGNGVYYLTGFPVSSDAPLSEGASLVVVYERNNLPQRAVTIYAGAGVIPGAIPGPTEYVMQTVMDIPAVCRCGPVETTFIVGDGQPGANEFITVNNAPLPGSFDGSEGNYMDTFTASITSYVNPGDTTVTLSIAMGSDCLMWGAQVFSAPFCTYSDTPIIKPLSSASSVNAVNNYCCDYVSDEIDQIVFVADERLMSACYHIADIYYSPTGLCYLNAIQQVCSLSTNTPVPGCEQYNTAYTLSIQNAITRFMRNCRSNRTALYTAADTFKNTLPNVCTYNWASSAVTGFGNQLEAIIKDVRLGALTTGISDAGKNYLGLACNSALKYPTHWLCGPYKSQCLPAAMKAPTDSTASLSDAAYIVDQQALVATMSLPWYCS